MENQQNDFTLNSFLPVKTPRVNKKEALKLIRSKWLRGEVQRFDVKLGKIMKTSIEKARVIREEWQSLGFLQYDKSGLLIWNDRKLQGVYR